ncbi:S-layer homology domain-containing protein [Caloranaerobacter ferrireducens]|uniref:S-layer homology domain-containing protein n=1 Tax=Caloranaerobacter ferrireducens TaxID=1323370 RepID=UPI00084DA947|nr:S-layer homology domain-containing protein [Caloranaerobacter ferrireducens]
MLKRVISLVVVFTMLFSMTISVSFAKGWDKEKKWKEEKFFKKINAVMLKNKVFDDLEGYPWARKAIEKMAKKGLIKGYGGGIYAPKKPVTNLETIIMCLRIMGWQDQAELVKVLPKKYKGKKVGDWAKGYIKIAYEKGILDDVDMMYFNPQGPAKRHQVAKYVIRALGYEEEALKHMKDELPFVDAPAVPLGSVGYIYLANELGLMKGDPQKRFNPMGTMTRAEMAVLFSRLDDKVDSNVDDKEIIGVVDGIYEGNLVLRTDGELRIFIVDENAIIYDGEERIDFSDIKKGYKVKVELENDKVVYIEVLKNEDFVQKIIIRYTGEVKEISKVEPRRIAVQVKQMLAIFDVLKGAKVKFKGAEGRFEDINIGDTITVIVDKQNRIREIFVHRERVGIEDEVDEIDEHEEEMDEKDEYEIEGILTAIDENSIKVTVSEEVYKFDVDEDVKIKIEDEEADLTDLVEGMEVEVKVEGGKVESIKAEALELEIEGKIIAITEYDSGVKLTIKTDNEEYEYMVSEDVEIEGEEDDIAIDDLEVGQEGEFKIVNNLIVKISIED